MLVMIPKGDGGNFWGIGLVEILWKTVTGILNHRFTSMIQFHDVLHRFQAGRGTGNATLEAKLLHHLTAMREAVLYNIFLEIQKT